MFEALTALIWLVVVGGGLFMVGYFVNKFVQWVDGAPNFATDIYSNDDLIEALESVDGKLSLLINAFEDEGDPDDTDCDDDDCDDDYCPTDVNIVAEDVEEWQTEHELVHDTIDELVDDMQAVVTNLKERVERLEGEKSAVNFPPFKYAPGVYPTDLYQITCDGTLTSGEYGVNQCPSVAEAVVDPADYPLGLQTVNQCVKQPSGDCCRTLNHSVPAPDCTASEWEAYLNQDLLTARKGNITVGIKD